MASDKVPVGKARRFGDLDVDGLFHDGITSGMGAKADAKFWTVYRKISATKAECVEKHGYGNSRGLGATVQFAVNHMVFQLEG